MEKAGGFETSEARPGAPVSVPLAWEDLSVDVRSDHFTATNVMEWIDDLAWDLWRDYFTSSRH